MREGPLLGVAKAARSPPCTHPFPGQRSILTTLNTSLLNCIVILALCF